MRWILAGIAILFVLQGGSALRGNVVNGATASSQMQAEVMTLSDASAPGVFSADLDIPFPCGSHGLGFSEPTDELEPVTE